MATFLRMPGVSADADEAVLDSWLVDPGASVAKGGAIAAVETEKAVVDIAAEADGVVHRLLAGPGDTIPVGDPIAIMLAPGEDPTAGDELAATLGGSAPAGSPPAPAATAEPAPTPQAPDTPAVPAPSAPLATGEESSPRRIFASPLARRLAREFGLDIGAIAGSGPRGRVLRDDVFAARSADQAAPEPQAAAAPPAGAMRDAALTAGTTAVEHTKLRRLIAERLQASKRDAPHFYLEATLNVDALLALRSQINAASSVRISVNDLFVKAAALALRDVPELNVIWTPDAVVSFETQDVAVAVASERGLVTPVIHDVGSLPLSAISQRISDAVTRANEGRLRQEELEGGALSVTNLGMFGVDAFSAIINPPHAAILAVGAARKTPVVREDDMIGVASLVTVTLSVDHRPVDGVIAARWLARLRELIEAPFGLLV